MRMFHIDRAEIQAQLRARGINPDHIKALHVKLQNGELDRSSFVLNAQQLRIPTDQDVITLQAQNRLELQRIGVDALKNNELALFWLNGGAATRYFDQTKISPEELERYGTQLQAVGEELASLPKGITPVVNGMSYLELKIRNLLYITKQCQLEVHPQVILMNSFITDGPTRKHLAELFVRYPDLDPQRFHFVVQQPTFPRFTKVEEIKNIDLFVDTAGELSWAPCGHGDFVYLVQDYLKHTALPGIKHLFFTNVDNLAAGIDPVLLGQHINSQTGRTVELVEKQPGDKGGEPCFVDNELVIVEQMKFPENFDHSKTPWFSTNTFWFSLDSLLNFNEDLPLILAEKTIHDNDVIQLERFACDVNVPSQFVVVDRKQRFWPVKRYVDLLTYQDPTFGDGSRYQDFQELLRILYDF